MLYVLCSSMLQTEVCVPVICHLFPSTLLLLNIFVQGCWSIMMLHCWAIRNPQNSSLSIAHDDLCRHIPEYRD